MLPFGIWTPRSLLHPWARIELHLPGGFSPLQFLRSQAREKPVGQEQEKRPGALRQVWEQGLGPPEHSSLSGWETRDSVHRCSCQLAGEGCTAQERSALFFPGGDELTHTKRSLGIQLKALGTAKFIFFCNAKGKTLREPVPQNILGLFFGLVQAMGPGWEHSL